MGKARQDAHTSCPLPLTQVDLILRPAKEWPCVTKGGDIVCKGEDLGKRTKNDKDIEVTSHIMLSVVKWAINTHWLNVLQLLKGS